LALDRGGSNDHGGWRCDEWVCRGDGRQTPSKKEVGLLTPGIPRSLVLAELGQPVATETRTGKRVEVYSFVQGYSKGVRVSRSIAHGAADVLTLGLWEAIGTPTEATFDGTRVAHEVTYDASRPGRAGGGVEEVTASEGRPQSRDTGRALTDRRRER
jgi:hypothetical protein